MKRLFVVMFAALLLLTLATMPASATVPSVATVAIVSTNDFHGALVGATSNHYYYDGGVKKYDNWGGAEWLTGYINIVRKENPSGVLWLDAGDAMQGTLISNYYYGSSTMEALNAMGINAMAIGNHEFDWGQQVLQDRKDQANFPFLAANVFYKKEDGNPVNGHGGRPHWAKPYVIRKVNGVNVGIIGISDPETPTTTNPANVSNLVFTDPVAAVNEVLREAKAEGATVIVVLAHVGGFYNSSTHSADGAVKDLACGLDSTKINLIVSGHTHSNLHDVLCGIPVVQAYSSGTAFSRVDFKVDVTTGNVVSYVMNGNSTTTYQTYNGNPATYKRWDTGVSETVVADPNVKAIVDHYSALIDAVKNQVIGHTNGLLSRDSCAESVMGDWATDIMRAYDPTIKFAFTNSGGLRTDLPAGDLTFGQVFEVMPFDNTLVTATVNGEQLKQLLEQAVAKGTKYCGTLAHGIIQVSGLKFDWRAIDGDRVSNVRYPDNSPVDLSAAATYKIAVNDFMANGGDSYTVLVTAPQTNTYVILRDITVNWIKTHSPFDPPALSGRITLLP